MTSARGAQPCRIIGAVTANRGAIPKLEPVTQPRSLFERVAFWQTAREYGKVLTPLTVIYARKPRLALIAQLITWTTEKGLTLEPGLRLLVAVHVAQLNGCAFCQDLNLARAVQGRLGGDRFRALPGYRTSELFSPRERAALAFVEEATRARKVSEATFEALRAHFNETEIVELTWLNAAENYFNLQAAVLGIGSDGLAGAEATGSRDAG